MSLKRYRLKAKKIKIEPKYIAQFIYVEQKEVEPLPLHPTLGFKIPERLV
jgi:hypothetical protein